MLCCMIFYDIIRYHIMTSYTCILITLVYEVALCYLVLLYCPAICYIIPHDYVVCILTCYITYENISLISRRASHRAGQPCPALHIGRGNLVPPYVKPSGKIRRASHRAGQGCPALCEALRENPKFNFTLLAKLKFNFSKLLCDSAPRFFFHIGRDRSVPPYVTCPGIPSCSKKLN